MEELLQKIKERFPYVTDDKVQEILGLGEIVILGEGEIFLKAGSRANKAAVVLQGMLRNYITTEKGEEVTVVFATEMQALAPYASVFLDKPASETTAAVEPSVLFTLDYKQFKERSINDPVYTRLYLDLFEKILLGAIQRIEDFTSGSPEQRYQRLLENHGFLIERAPLKYLASYLGITPVSLSRIRKRLAKNRN